MPVQEPRAVLLRIPSPWSDGWMDDDEGYGDSSLRVEAGTNRCNSQHLAHDSSCFGKEVSPISLLPTQCRIGKSGATLLIEAILKIF